MVALRQSIVKGEQQAAGRQRLCSLLVGEPIGQADGRVKAQQVVQICFKGGNIPHLVEVLDVGKGHIADRVVKHAEVMLSAPSLQPRERQEWS